ncbi:hypothetical protein AGIG_G8758 [Arapaima gigas]
MQSKFHVSDFGSLRKLRRHRIPADIRKAVQIRSIVCDHMSFSRMTGVVRPAFLTHGRKHGKEWNLCAGLLL